MVAHKCKTQHTLKTQHIHIGNTTHFPQNTTHLMKAPQTYLKHNAQTENTIHLSETQYTVKRRLDASNISAGLMTRRRNTKHRVFLMWNFREFSLCVVFQINVLCFRYVCGALMSVLCFEESVLCFDESVLCYQCVFVVFSMCVVFCTYGPPYAITWFTGTQFADLHECDIQVPRSIKPEPLQCLQCASCSSSGSTKNDWERVMVVPY